MRTDFSVLFARGALPLARPLTKPALRHCVSPTLRFILDHWNKEFYKINAESPWRKAAEKPKCIMNDLQLAERTAHKNWNQEEKSRRVIDVRTVSRQ